MIINTNNMVSITEAKAEIEQVMPDEDVTSISRRIMEKNKEAYEVLAK